MEPQAKLQIAEMMRKMNVDKIRVVDICREAGIGRQTFYYHFQDKHDLLAWMFLQTMGDLDIISVPDVIAALKRMKEDYRFFSHAYEDSSLVPFWQYMLEYYVRRFEDSARICLGVGKLDPATEFCIRMYSYGGIGMTREWLNGSEMPAEELVRLYYTAMPELLKQIYRVDVSVLEDAGLRETAAVGREQRQRKTGHG